MMVAGSKKDLRVSGGGLGGSFNVSFSLLIKLFSFLPPPLPWGEEGGGGNEHTWRAQYNAELYAAFGKDESFLNKQIILFFYDSRNHRCDDLLHGRGLWFKSRIAHPRFVFAIKCRTLDLFMHVPFGPGMGI